MLATKKSFWKSLSAFDLFPKNKDEIKQQSGIGAVVSVVGALVLLILLISETNDYFRPRVEDTLTVKHGTRGEKMKINLRLVFLELPCDVIGLDVTDRLGEEQVGVKIEKHPWRGNIEMLKEESTRGWFGFRKGYAFQNALWSNLVKTAKAESRVQQCQSCFDGERVPGQCCNSCLSLKKAYIDKGLPVERAANLPQCQAPEGCLVAGSMEVNRVAGNFHFAVGESHVEANRHHHHWPEAYRKLGFNTTHYISHLSFGAEYPGQVNPLDGFSYNETVLGQMQYFIQVVPTTYQKSNGRVVDTNQYSVTYQHSPVDLTSEHIELPGLFFKYDISAIMINLREEYTPFTKFITRICAMMGGVWVVLGLVYTVLSNTFSTVVRKLE